MAPLGGLLVAGALCSLVAEEDVSLPKTIFSSPLACLGETPSLELNERTNWTCGSSGNVGQKAYDPVTAACFPALGAESQEVRVAARLAARRQCRSAGTRQSFMEW